MNAFEEKERPIRHRPFGGLESPFLDQELFTGQGEKEWGANLGALEGESPFLSVLETPSSDDALPGDQYEEESTELDLEAGFDPDVEFQAPGGISGVDDRREVRDTTIPPYRWVCSIAYEAGGRTLQGGTGVLISSRHVLTAAHVIRDKATAPAAHSVYVYPGRHIGGEPFGRIPVERARVTGSNFDFGLITLERPVDPAGRWWGHPSSPSAWWSEASIPLRELVDPGIPLSTAGYPSAKDRQRRRMYESNGSTVPRAFAGSFRHTLDTTEGQSGSPIWTVRGGRFILIGIVTSYDQTGQSAVFVQMVRREIGRWMAEDAPKVKRRIALEVPYRWVCRLEVYDNDLGRKVGYGTGLMISDRHVLTSARVIHDFSRDRRKYSIRITPGYEFGKEAFGSTTASKARVSPKFSPAAKDGAADYGLLTLSQSLGRATHSSIGNARLGSWEGPTHGLSTSAADWSGKLARIAAFSRASGGGGGYHKLRISSGEIVGLQPGQILHKASSKLDAPGAPIWVEGGGRRLLVGIASPIFSKDSSVNRGCYLSQENLSYLMQWVNEDYVRSELKAGDHFSQDELESLPAFPDTEVEGRIAAMYPEPELYGEQTETHSNTNYSYDAEVDYFAQPAADTYITAEDNLETAAEAESQIDDFLGEPDSAETGYEFDTPPTVSNDITEALKSKDWALALKLAIEAGWRDENNLTNIIFFARHPELPKERLDPKDPAYKQLSAEWKKILDEDIWKAIKVSAENTDLAVSGEEVTDHHRSFFRGKSGKRLKKLVEDAAREASLNPGLLGTIMMAETRRPLSYLSSEKVSSYHIGCDDFFEARAAIKARVPAYAKIKWDRKQKPVEHLNDARTNPRLVKTILFDSGSDAALATAVYVKFREVRLKEIAAELGKDFDSLPLPTRFALTRISMAAGTGGATPYLKDALNGVDIFVRQAIPVRAYQTKRNATVRTAQAMHLSDWIFGIAVEPATLPQGKEMEGWDEEQEGLRDLNPDREEESGDDPQNLDFESASAEGEMGDDSPPVLIQHDVPAGSTREVVVGQRVEIDLTKTRYAANLDKVRWSVPGKVVRNYKGTADSAKLFELTRTELEQPKIFFFWVDAAEGRTVQARIRTTSGANEVFAVVFNVKGPKMKSFTGMAGKNRLHKTHGQLKLQLGKPGVAPGVQWKWEITMPPNHAGFIKDIQTVLIDRSKIL
ncbi:MAG: trypsin-like peptidase domain-containing protein, partial [Desulfobacterales bacterium]